ncbi:hypothetical protein [Variovorax sp. YR216]|uniref:hypothetical protein n=1 Tax=Variovorax sp. YR216 TaxID=1882828 RepID=UPI0015A3471F|nr:hypothetical protein [Variovorax sp. YR216]
MAADFNRTSARVAGQGPNAMPMPERDRATASSLIIMNSLRRTVVAASVAMLACLLRHEPADMYLRWRTHFPKVQPAIRLCQQ